MASACVCVCVHARAAACCAVRAVLVGPGCGAPPLFLRPSSHHVDGVMLLLLMIMQLRIHPLLFIYECCMLPRRLVLLKPPYERFNQDELPSSFGPAHTAVAYHELLSEGLGRVGGGMR